MGFVVDGKIYYAHYFNNANNLTSVYMSTPNHSIRYEIRSTGGVATLDQICSSVSSEGGEEALGTLNYVSTAGASVIGTTENIIYALIGIRLKSTHLDLTAKILSAALQIGSVAHAAEWMVIFNPTVAGTFTYGGLANSGMDYAIGATANTVTGGKILQGGFLESGAGKGSAGSAGAVIENALRLG